MAKLFRTVVKTGSKKAFARIKAAAKEMEYNKEMRKEIGAFVVDRIQRTARSGKSIADGQSFNPLKPSTVKFRESLAKYNQTHPLFKPKRSNLTITGQLIDSVKYTIKGSIIDVRPSGTHKPYNTKPGKKRGGWDSSEAKSNEAIAKDLLDQGRVFIGLDKTGQDRVLRILQRWARRLLRLK